MCLEAVCDLRKCSHVLLPAPDVSIFWMQVHVFDHTLSKEVQNSVARTPGVHFHPIGIATESQGTGATLVQM